MPINIRNELPYLQVEPLSSDAPVIKNPDAMREELNNVMTKRMLELIYNMGGREVSLQREEECLASESRRLANDVVQLKAAYSDEMKALSEKIVTKIEVIYNKIQQDFFQHKILSVSDYNKKYRELVSAGLFNEGELWARDCPMIHMHFKSIFNNLKKTHSLSDSLVLEIATKDWRSKQKLKYPQSIDNAEQRLVSVDAVPQRLIIGKMGNEVDSFMLSSTKKIEALENQISQIQESIELLQEQKVIIEAMHSESIIEYKQRMRISIKSIRNYSRFVFIPFLDNNYQTYYQKHNDMPNWTKGNCALGGMYFGGFKTAEKVKKSVEEIIVQLQEILDNLKTESI